MTDIFINCNARITDYIRTHLYCYCCYYYCCCYYYYYYYYYYYPTQRMWLYCTGLFSASRVQHLCLHTNKSINKCTGRIILTRWWNAGERVPLALLSSRSNSGWPSLRRKPVRAQ